jgi:hypothetical protein
MSNTLALFTPQVRYALIAGYDGAYRISDHGTFDSRKRSDDWRPLQLNSDSHGSLCVTLFYKGKSQAAFAHQYVAHYFIGPCPRPGLIVCHNDGINTHNHYTNLRWDTYPGNMQDRNFHGTGCRAEDNPNAKLTRDLVREIRAKGSPGAKPWLSVQRLAEEYKVSGVTIRNVLLYKTWNEEAYAEQDRLHQERIAAYAATIAGYRQPVLQLSDMAEDSPEEAQGESTLSAM